MSRDGFKMFQFCLVLVVVALIARCQDEDGFGDDLSGGAQAEPEGPVLGPESGPDPDSSENETDNALTDEKPDLTGVEPANVAQLVRRMFQSYEKLERPYYRGKPVEVTIRFDVSSISHISEENMEFQASVYFAQLWTDPRLAFDVNNSMSCIMLRSDQIKRVWLPDTYISNARSYVIDPYTPTVKIYGDGLIEYSFRLSITLLSSMNFLYYPMDHQKLHIDIYTYNYKFNQVRLDWDRGSIIVDDIAAYVVKRVNKSSQVHYDGTAEYSFLSFIVIVRRRLRYFLLQFFFPCIICAFVSFLPFWMDRYEIGERLALGITTLLTEVFLSQYINSSMPRVSYIKAADEYLLATFIFIFIALIESVVVYNYRPDVVARKKEERKNRSKNSVRTFMKENLGLNDRKKAPISDCHGIEMNFQNENVNKNDQVNKEQTSTIVPSNKDEADVPEYRGEDPPRDKSLLIDKTCRVMFPLLYLAFQGYYFGRYCPDFYTAYTS